MWQLFIKTKGVWATSQNWELLKNLLFKPNRRNSRAVSLFILSKGQSKKIKPFQLEFDHLRNSIYPKQHLIHWCRYKASKF